MMRLTLASGFFCYFMNALYVNNVSSARIIDVKFYCVNIVTINIYMIFFNVK